MASGLGLKGTVGRCFYYFEDFTVCMKTDNEPLKNCLSARDDYLECLHNKKEVSADVYLPLPSIARGSSDYFVSRAYSLIIIALLLLLFLLFFFPPTFSLLAIKFLRIRRLLT